MSGIVGSRFNIKGSGLVGSLGTDGQVFTSSGTGTGHIFEDAGGGAWTFIQSHTASDDALIAFVDQFSATYDLYKIFITNTQAAGDGKQFFVQWRQGGSYLTSNYRYGTAKVVDAGTVAAIGSQSASYMFITPDGSGNATGECSTWEITLADPLGTDNTKGMFYHAYNYNYTPVAHYICGAGMNTTYAAVDGIKFYYDAGNVARGEFALYGLNKS